MTDDRRVTEERRTAGPVRASEEHFRMLVEGVKDYAIFMLDPGGYIATWNPGAQRIKGYRPDEIIGKHFSTFYLPEEVQAGKPPRELEIAAAVGKYEEEGWRVRKDGTTFWANVLITALRDGRGVLCGFAKVSRDLSERRRAEEALRLSEERYRMLVEKVDDYAIFLLDPQGRVSSWNPGAERIKGYAAPEILGRHFSTFYPEADREAGKPAWELEVAAARGKYQEEGWRVRKDGSRFWASVLITALKDEGGDLKGFSKITRDLTERKHFEQTLQDKNRELERAIRSKDQFLANMSHELRTPMNAVLGFTGTLLMRLPGPLTPDQEKQLRTVQTSARHLLSLLNDLLDLAKIDSGKLELNRQPVVCQQVVQEVAASLAPAAQAKGIELRTEVPPSDVVVRADRRALSQILLNLANNALKFTDRGAVRIELAERQAGGRRVAEVSVADTGVGIRDEDRAKLFQPFSQVGDPDLRERGGSGLGLHVSQRLAALMGGEITVESEPGRGSRFTVRLGGGLAMGARILVVEDNAPNLELITYLLGAFGHTAVTARDGEKGWEAARGQPFDLFLFDVQLPRKDGYELARLLKVDAGLKGVPLLAVTALALVGDREKVLGAGFDGYIPKPIDPETFVGEVEAFLPPQKRGPAAPRAGGAAGPHPGGR